MPYPIPFYMRVGASNALTHAELDSNQKILSDKIDLTVGNNLGSGTGIYLNKTANANDGFLNFRTLAGLSGTSIFISGDTLVVGAPADDDAATDAGAVYVYTRSGTTWSQQAKLTASGGAASDAFGKDVIIRGDVIVSGAEYEDTTANNSGAIYVFTRSGTTWSQQVKKKADTPISDSNFGDFVSLSGNTIVVPAKDENSYKGAVYVYTA